MKNLPAHLLVDEMIDLFERPAVHVLGKRLKLSWQQRAVLHLDLRARMEAILADELNMSRLVLVLRALGVLDDLNLICCFTCKQKHQKKGPKNNLTLMWKTIKFCFDGGVWMGRRLNMKIAKRTSTFLTAAENNFSVCRGFRLRQQQRI